MSSLFDKIKSKVFRGSHATSDAKRKKNYHNIKFNENPEDFWKKVNVIGDGAFGKVYKVMFLTDKLLLFAFCSSALCVWIWVFFLIEFFVFNF